jgi:hypothetical protein
VVARCHKIDSSRHDICQLWIGTVDVGLAMLRAGDDAGRENNGRPSSSASPTRRQTQSRLPELFYSVKRERASRRA